MDKFENPMDIISIICIMYRQCIRFIITRTEAQNKYFDASVSICNYSNKQIQVYKHT